LDKTGSVLAIDAGGTKIHIAVAKDGDIILDTKFPTHPEKGGEQCLTRIIETSRDLIKQSNVSIGAIGLASPGIVHPHTKATEHTWNIPDWDNLHVVNHLQEAFDVPVAIENDANMAAIAESEYGDHGPSFIFCAIGTGFGSGIVLNNQLWSGKHGGAGEIARWVMGAEGLNREFNYGHLEYLMSGSGFETRYLELSGEHLTGGEIAVRAHEGDAIAQQILHDGAVYLGIAAANASTLLDLDAVVLGGGVIVKEPSLWLTQVQALTQKLCLYPPEIKVSKLGDTAVLLGALTEAYRIGNGGQVNGPVFK
jgi:glucokinase